VNAQAEAWARQELESRGITAHDLVWERLRPWSRVAKITTDGVPFWLKINLGDTLYEAGLMRLLGTIAPAHVVVPLAVDTAKGWSLNPDGGPTLRESHPTFAIPVWERLLAEYAELQRELTPHVRDLLAVGVPDLSPEKLPAHLSALLDLPQVRSSLDISLVRPEQPKFAQECAELAASPIGPTLQHDDLHDNNVFAFHDRFAFFDWGDSCVSHPFGTLLVTLRVAAAKAEIKAGDPVLARLRSAYLEPWTAEHDRADLERWAYQAMRVSKVTRSLSYVRALAAGDDADWAEWGEGVHGWLEEIAGPDMW
jgi:hypothetical protein